MEWIYDALPNHVKDGEFHKVWVEADVPLPEAPTVEGKVVPEDATQEPDYNEAEHIAAQEVVRGDELDDKREWAQVKSVSRSRHDGQEMHGRSALRQDDINTVAFENGESHDRDPEDVYKVRVFQVHVEYIRVGDKVLMPDNTTWCTIKEKSHIYTFMEDGFMTPRAGEMCSVRRTGSDS